MAIKSPSIQYHLAGTKKVQQELANPGKIYKCFQNAIKLKYLYLTYLFHSPFYIHIELFSGVLEKFFDDPNKVERVRKIFTGLYSMDKVIFARLIYVKLVKIL